MNNRFTDALNEYESKNNVKVRVRGVGVWTVGRGHACAQRTAVFTAVVVERAGTS